MYHCGKGPDAHVSLCNAIRGIGGLARLRRSDLGHAGCCAVSCTWSQEAIVAVGWTVGGSVCGTRRVSR